MGAHLHAHQRRRVRHGRDGGGGARWPVPAAAPDVAPCATACATRTTGVRRVGARTGAAVRAALGAGRAALMAQDAQGSVSPGGYQGTPLAHH
jgi:hypothetical protein